MTEVVISLMRQYFAKLCTLTNEQIIRGDFNEDGSFDILDATALQLYLAQLN